MVLSPLPQARGWGDQPEPHRTRDGAGEVPASSLSPGGGDSTRALPRSVSALGGRCTRGAEAACECARAVVLRRGARLQERRGTGARLSWREDGERALGGGRPAKERGNRREHRG